jgi:hypothetical protein
MDFTTLGTISWGVKNARGSIITKKLDYQGGVSVSLNNNFVSLFGFWLSKKFSLFW